MERSLHCDPNSEQAAYRYSVLHAIGNLIAEQWTAPCLPFIYPPTIVRYQNRVQLIFPKNYFSDKLFCVQKVIDLPLPPKPRGRFYVKQSGLARDSFGIGVYLIVAPGFRIDGGLDFRALSRRIGRTSYKSPLVAGARDEYYSLYLYTRT